MSEPGEHGARFERALNAYRELLSTEGPDVGDECHSVLLHDGRPAERACLLLHGFTNCPAQYSRIALSLHEAGVAVLAPLAPGHGRADGSPRALADLTAPGLAEWTSGVVDIAAGLGESLTVAGFSFGGVCATWAARNRTEVDEVVLIAPAFLPYGYPLWAAPTLPWLARVLPERHLWWDPLRRERILASPYSYRKISQRGIGAVFELGQDAWHQPPMRGRALNRAALVLNEWDFAISGAAARKAFEDALVPIARHAEVHRLEASLRLPHDYLDPLGRNSAREADARTRVLGFLGVSVSSGDEVVTTT